MGTWGEAWTGIACGSINKPWWNKLRKNVFAAVGCPQRLYSSRDGRLLAGCMKQCSEPAGQPKCLCAWLPQAGTAEQAAQRFVHVYSCSKHAVG